MLCAGVPRCTVTELGVKSCQRGVSALGRREEMVGFIPNLVVIPRSLIHVLELPFGSACRCLGGFKEVAKAHLDWMYCLV